MKFMSFVLFWVSPLSLPLSLCWVFADLVHTVAKTGGHLGSSLGVVELTVALHHVFNTPEDKIIWDVGHQAYIHKILTGRRERMSTIRQQGGLSGFTKRSESVYDPFGAGHSSTSISAALGMAVGRDFKARKNNCIAVSGIACSYRFARASTHQCHDMDSSLPRGGIIKISFLSLSLSLFLSVNPFPDHR